MTHREDQQAPTNADASAQPPGRPWLGLVTDHRRLFGALEDGWLRPLPERAGVLVGIEAYASEQADASPADRRIAVRLRLDAAKLPAPEVFVRRRARWVPCRFAEAELESTDALYWPGPLPAFAISRISVSTEEERQRLMGIAGAVSNVDLSASRLQVDSGSELKIVDALPEVERPLIVPEDEDAIHSALSMALWAVPRIDPWLDLLVACLASDLARLSKAAEAVDAKWWRFLPWARSEEGPGPADLDDRLWRAAVDVFRGESMEHRAAPREMAGRIASAAARHGDSVESDAVSAWLQDTQRVLRGDSTISCDEWRARPVGIALQLVLTRPEPAAFKSWFLDRPDLPPGVWWSAATLCGLLQGYRRLDKQFRGDALQRELLSIHALRACRADGWDNDRRPMDPPTWRREGAEVVLSWGGGDFARKAENARGQWYAADFRDAEVLREARAVAKKMTGWSCVNREIELTDQRVQLSGAGVATIRNGSEQTLDVRGTVRLQFPEGAEVREVLDIDSFRRAVAINAGRVPNPPSRPVHAGRCATIDKGVPGLTYVPGFLDEREEEDVVSAIDKSEWRFDLKRRVQHYGWRYDYKARRIDPSMRLGSLPAWAARIANRLVSAGLLRDLPDQVIVNEYRGKQGISRHTDSEPSFADGIATVSLLESWEMVFREKERQNRKVSVLLERRSAAIMSGDARYRWTHEIPARQTEPGRQGRWTRGRRLSLTFRKVLASTDDRRVPMPRQPHTKGSVSGQESEAGPHRESAAPPTQAGRLPY